VIAVATAVQEVVMSDHFWQRSWRFLRWFFGAPFRAMSEAFGDPVPPEVRQFEARAAEIQHLDRGSANKARVDHAQTRALKS
jgi:hypothetical protein